MALVEEYTSPTVSKLAYDTVEDQSDNNGYLESPERDDDTTAEDKERISREKDEDYIVTEYDSYDEDSDDIYDERYFINVSKWNAVVNHNVQLAT